MNKARRKGVSADFPAVVLLSCSRLDADRPDKVNGAVRPRVRSVGADDRASVRHVHFANILGLSRAQVVSDQVGSRQPGAAAVIKLFSRRRVVEFAAGPSVRLSVA